MAPVQPEPSQMRSAPSCAVRMSPASSWVERSPPQALQRRMPHVATVCQGEDCQTVWFVGPLRVKVFFCSSETRKPFYVYSKSGPLISFLLKISKHPFVQMLHTLPLTTESETMSVTNATGFNHDLFLLLNNPFFSS